MPRSGRRSRSSSFSPGSSPSKTPPSAPSSRGRSRSVASHEGIVAVEDAAGRHPHPIDYDKVPSCTYCDPEVASVGLTEEAARERGYDVVVGQFPFSAIGKAKILNDTRGFVKIVAEKK